MDITASSQSLFRRHIALPQDHGSWVFLLSPLLIGLFAGGVWNFASFLLVVACMSAFLLRQPVAIATKVYSGRRPKRELLPAQFWIAIYGLVGLLALAGLVFMGHLYLLVLLAPGLPVFAWHLYLVSRRIERRQMAVELVGCGVLALAAPAALWVSRGQLDPQGWWLWLLVWLQSAASIVYAYLRLEQRVMQSAPAIGERVRMGRRAISFTTFNLLLVSGLLLAGYIPALLPLPYTLQWLETVWGTLKPAVGVKPTHIGIRQLIVSTLFTVLFILAWTVL
ncbi:MAG: hypothetical protein EHM70_03465 [Chloroflexota bacterium]|nr:MAG: hypothetical protein EHM70_03465 [Chloroflexota bacterium]